MYDHSLAFLEESERITVEWKEASNPRKKIWDGGRGAWAVRQSSVGATTSLRIGDQKSQAYESDEW